MENLSTRPAWARLASLLGHRAWLAVVALLGTSLTLGAVDDGFTLDDLVHRAMVQGRSDLLQKSTLDLFHTATGDPQQVARLVDAGAFPWFSVPDLRIAFWRPLAAATHALDYSLWPDAAGLMHAQNLVWYAALIVTVGLVVGRICNAPWAGGVAALVFALDELHAEAVGWIACRNGLMASVFALSALLVHHRWRRDGVRHARWLALALLGMGLLSGEVALGGLGYLVSYAFLLERGSVRERALSVLPYVALTATWMLTYKLAGYGVHGSGYYVDPFGEPRAFAAAILHNAPVLFVMQLGLPPGAALWVGSHPVTAPILAWAPVAAFAGFFVVLGPVVVRDRAARFWLVGMLVALVPVCATLPKGRLLLLVGVGAAGLVSRLVAALVGPKTSTRWEPPWRASAVAVTALMFGAHLFFAPFDVPRLASRSGREAALDEASVSTAPVGDLADKTIILVRAPHAFAGARWLLTRRSDASSPSAVRMLYAGAGVVSVVREDEHTIVMVAPNGLLTEPVSWLFRGLHHPFDRGQHVELPGVSIEVRDTTMDGRPSHVAFRFHRGLNEASMVWLVWRTGRWERFELPPSGGTVGVW